MEKKKQFLPALLERLLDDEPKKHIEPHDNSFMTHGRCGNWYNVIFQRY